MHSLRMALIGAAGMLLAAAGISSAHAQSAPENIRIGYAVSLSGPYAQGAESTTWSQYKLWAKDVNDAGDIMLSKYNKKVPELIEYDDRSQLEEATRLVERLILNDKGGFRPAALGHGDQSRRRALAQQVRISGDPVHHQLDDLARGLAEMALDLLRLGATGRRHEAAVSRS